MMNDQEDLKSALRQKAAGLLARLGSAEREALLVKNWMSHDARWFMAVAKEYGLEVTNRLNRIAAHGLGKAEAQRLVRALELGPVARLDDCLLVQEAFISLLGPDLLDYRVTKVGDNAFRVDVQRCFAHDQAVRAGITERFECGIFARITGWLDALGLAYETSPPQGPCLKTQGRECGEPPQLSRRLHFLRGWGHGNVEQVLTGSTGARRAAGSGAPRRTPVAMGGHRVDRGEDRLHAETLRHWVRQAERDARQGDIRGRADLRRAADIRSVRRP